MRIGELSKQTGFQVETLRYYEKQGLLKPVSRTEAGYREYDNKSLKQLKFIDQAKSVGFSLNEISELLTLRVEPDQHSCSEVKNIAEQKLEHIETKIAELTKMRDALHVITDACCGGSEPATSCTILSALDDGSNPISTTSTSTSTSTSMVPKPVSKRASKGVTAS